MSYYPDIILDIVNAAAENNSGVPTHATAISPAILGYDVTPGEIERHLKLCVDKGLVYPAEIPDSLKKDGECYCGSATFKGRFFLSFLELKGSYDQYQAEPNDSGMTAFFDKIGEVADRGV